jgi:hypothetical protein
VSREYLTLELFANDILHFVKLRARQWRGKAVLIPIFAGQKAHC